MIRSPNSSNTLLIH